MYAIVIFFLAITPAILYGWFLPNLFTLFDSSIDAPLNKRTWVLSTLTLPWLIGAGWWMMWMFDYRDGRFGIDVWYDMLLAMFVACFSTSLRRKVLPKVIRSLRDWFERLDKWMYSHT